MHPMGIARCALASLILPAVFLALSASPAAAFRGHAFASDFGWGVVDGKAKFEVCTKACQVGVAGAGVGQFSGPSDVAVNEATGRVYVLDQGNGRVEVFSHKEEYVSQFDGSGTPAKAFVFPTQPLTGGIAVDNSCFVKKLSGSACTKADPSNGDVYVTDPGNHVVDKFNAEGAYLSQLEEACGKASCPPFKFESIITVTPAGIGVDASGTVWVSQKGQHVSGDVDSFTDGEPGIFVSARQLENVGGFVCPGFAVDSEDALYARKGASGNCSEPPLTVSKFAVSGGGLIAPFASEETSAVAVDLVSDEVFLDNVTSVGAFSSGGVGQERFGSGDLSGGAGVGVDRENSTDSTVYVADAAADRVVVFGPEPPGAPMVVGESVVSVTGGSATLEAEVDPHGASTGFHFEYGRCATLAACASSGYEESIPVPDAVAGSDFEIHSVSANPQDLAPGTAYHFRVVAHNGLPEAGTAVAGQEQTFTTQPAGVFGLPDGRAWEMVSPPDKHGALLESISRGGAVQASAAGDAITYLADAPTESQPQGNASSVQVLSTRAGGVWGSRDIAPPHESATGQPVGAGEEYRFFSSDLSAGVVQRFGGFMPSLSALASEQTPYLHSDREPCSGSCYSAAGQRLPGKRRRMRSGCG